MKINIKSSVSESVKPQASLSENYKLKSQDFGISIDSPDLNTHPLHIIKNPYDKIPSPKCKTHLREGIRM
ncbi:MAG: hypothetical protein K1X92_16340 [Bacteroidia bacterium]|nr:hypothetical protein [Bacteroidia bacterium]